MCIAIECSYKLDQKNELKFLCELCTFSQIRSHILLNLITYQFTIGTQHVNMCIIIKRKAVLVGLLNH